MPIDASSNYFGAPGIAIRADGRPVVTASWYGGLRYYDCQDAACASFTYNQIWPSGSAILSDMPIALQPNGYPAFIYIDDTLPTAPRPGYLIVHFGADSACSSASEQTLAMPAAESPFSTLSFAFDANGYAAATYFESEGPSNTFTYNLARCADTACATVSNAQISVSAVGSAPFRTALALRAGGLPLALDSRSTHIALLDCTTSDCTTFNDRALPASASGVPIGFELAHERRAGILAVCAEQCRRVRVFGWAMYVRRGNRRDQYYAVDTRRRLRPRCDARSAARLHRFRHAQTFRRRLQRCDLRRRF